MNVRATDSARWQLRAAVEALKRSGGTSAAAFVGMVRELLKDRATIERAAVPIAGFPDLPVSEIVLHGHRLFFRSADGILWLSGVWRMPDAG